MFDFLSSQPPHRKLWAGGRRAGGGEGLGAQSPPPRSGVNSGEGARGQVTKQRKFASCRLRLVADLGWELAGWGAGRPRRRSRAGRQVLETESPRRKPGSRELRCHRNGLGVSPEGGGTQERRRAPLPIPLGGCLPCCQSNWRARLRGRIPELARPPNPLQRLPLTSGPWQPMWRRHRRAKGRGRGEVRGGGGERGAARDPHVHSHTLAPTPLPPPHAPEYPTLRLRGESPRAPLSPF